MLNGKNLCYLFFFSSLRFFFNNYLFFLWSWYFLFWKQKKDGSTDTQIEMFSCCQRSLKKIKAASQMEDTYGRGYWGQKWGLSGGAGHFDPPVFSFSVKISVWYIEMAAFFWRSCTTISFRVSCCSYDTATLHDTGLLSLSCNSVPNKSIS